MVNAFRLMIFVIVLAVVIGSIMVTSAEDARITINSPSDGDTVNTKTITVSGTVVGDQGAVIESVTVNGDLAVGTGPEGGFSSWEKHISLQKGKNMITVEVTDIFGHNTTKNRSVFYITPPSAPQTLQLTAGHDYVNLCWIAPHDDGGSKITKYNIYRGTAPGGESLLKTVGNVLIYEDHDVTNDQRYYYQVSAVNSVGEGEKSMDASASPKPTPTASPTSSPVSTPKPPPTPAPTSSPTPTNLPPVCSFRCSTKSPEINELVEFDASDSSDHDGKIKVYLWDFGDEKEAQGEVVRHSYSTGGTCTVKLRVIDNGGAEDSNETIIVINRPPKGYCKLDPNMPKTNELITFDASLSKDPDKDGSIKEYRWDFGDGETGRGMIVYHNYSQADKYDVKLTVTDNKGSEGVFDLKVSVISPDPNWEKWAVVLSVLVLILTPVIRWIIKKWKENRDDDVIKTVSLPVGETLSLGENLTEYGSLSISSNPSGASVYLDGDYIGETPMNISDVVVGSHSFKLKKRFYADVEKEMLVSAGINKPVAESLSFSTWCEVVQVLGALVAIGLAGYGVLKYLIPFILSTF